MLKEKQTTTTTTTKTDNGMTVQQILENSQERNNCGILFYYSYRSCNFMKTGPHHGCFRENFPKFSESIIFM